MKTKYTFVLNNSSKIVLTQDPTEEPLKKEDLYTVMKSNNIVEISSKTDSILVRPSQLIAIHVSKSNDNKNIPENIDYTEDEYIPDEEYTEQEPPEEEYIVEESSDETNSEDTLDEFDEDDELLSEDFEDEFEEDLTESNTLIEEKPVKQEYYKNQKQEIVQEDIDIINNTEYELASDKVLNIEDDPVLRSIIQEADKNNFKKKR